MGFFVWLGFFSGFLGFFGFWFWVWFCCVFPSLRLLRHLCQNTFTTASGFYQSRSKLCIFSVKTMHHKQLSLFTPFSFTHKVFLSSVLPFSSRSPPWLVPSFICYWKSRTGSSTLNLFHLTLSMHWHKMGPTWGLDQTLLNSNRSS